MSSYIPFQWETDAAFKDLSCVSLHVMHQCASTNSVLMERPFLPSLFLCVPVPHLFKKKIKKIVTYKRNTRMVKPHLAERHGFIPKVL